MSLHKRLEDLEARTQTQQGYEVSRSMEHFFHAHENARREIHGLEPLDDLPYTKEDYQDDLKVLGEHIPKMRAEPGWQAGKEKTFLDEWERKTRERTEGKS